MCKICTYHLQVSENELVELVANCDRFSSLKHSTSFPYAFTEQGVSMLSAVLKSNERGINIVSEGRTKYYSVKELKDLLEE